MSRDANGHVGAGGCGVTPWDPTSATNTNNQQLNKMICTPHNGQRGMQMHAKPGDSTTHKETFHDETDASIQISGYTHSLLVYLQAMSGRQQKKWTENNLN